MHATVATIHDPFHPMRNREVRLVRHRSTIAELAPVTQKPFICLRNGQAVLRKDWGDTVADGEMIAFVTLPQGGGGGSNPLRILLMIAVMWFAPWAGNYLAGQMLAGGMISSASAGMVGSLLGGVIGIAGSMLVNALIPPPKPTQAAVAAGMPGASPTYNLQAQGNMARLEAPIPVHYGRLKFFPDFGAQPYAEYYGNEQYLYQLFVLGQGYFDIEAIQIEDTPIDSWDDITYEVIEPNGTLTMFPANVVTSGEVSGQSAAGTMTGTYSQTGTTITVTITDHLLLPGSNVYLDFTTGTGDDGAYEVVTAGSSTFTVTSASSETTSGNVTLYKYLGPFIANASETDANTLGVDVVLPSGLFYFDGDGNMNSQTVTFSVEAQEVDDSGTPVGSWATLGSETITAATSTPQRYSYRYSVTAARYWVRLRRTNAETTGTGYSSSMVWAGLRAYLPDVRDFGYVTLLAMRLKASNNLSMQSSRKINVIATRRLNTWHPVDGWTASPVATRSIAWALADMLKADYGGQVADARIDLQALYDLDVIWAARGDRLDGRFDSAGTLWDALTTASIAGRSKPYVQGGIAHFARDQEQAFPVALFSMRNIARGSFNVDYLMTSEETADAVDVTYFSDASWTPQRVLCALPGSSSLKPAKLNLFGVTDREQAYREGIYFCAANRHRRKIIKFETEMEGFIPSFGDLIAVQHDMPQWGQHGEVKEVVSASNLLLRSQALHESVWAKTNLSCTGGDINAAAAPDNSVTADRANEGAVAAVAHRFVQDFASVASAPYCLSVCAKPDTRSRIYLSLRSADGVNGASASFNLTDGTLTASTTFGSGFTLDLTGIEAVGNGFYRAYLVATSSLTSTRAYFGLLNDSGASTYDGESKGLFVWGMQVSPSSTLIPYVHTVEEPKTGITACVLTEPLTWSAGATHYAGLRQKDGAVEGPITVTWAGADAFACATEPLVAPYAGSDYERTHATFGWAETWRQEARVIAVRPRGLEQVEIECVNEDPSVHTADEGIFAPAVSSSQLNTLYTAPVVAGLTAVSAPDDVLVVLLSWQQAAGADYYIVEQSADGVEWSRVAETRANNFSFRVAYGNGTVMRVAAVGLTRGPWVTINYGSVADYMWDAVTSTLMWSVTTTDLMWR